MVLSDRRLRHRRGAAPRCNRDDIDAALAQSLGWQQTAALPALSQSVDNRITRSDILVDVEPRSKQGLLNDMDVPFCISTS